jgi:hypothetical protein
MGLIDTKYKVKVAVFYVFDYFCIKLSRLFNMEITNYITDFKAIDSQETIATVKIFS